MLFNSKLQTLQHLRHGVHGLYRKSQTLFRQRATLRTKDFLISLRKEGFEEDTSKSPGTIFPFSFVKRAGTKPASDKKFYKLKLIYVNYG
ncbi:hypothetical protein COU57_00930 [Candidatus Pacearchaeota archaeon CG10_big_fil_rev_8_21_14_0_10_32_14]|nr:MAG: hypothetical protein COU57_00930 [Candidatus Pacearchaeota archaeon CG10_big_fil_rev_8_21_14_0_10_32_14]